MPPFSGVSLRAAGISDSDSAGPLDEPEACKLLGQRNFKQGAVINCQLSDTLLPLYIPILIIISAFLKRKTPSPPIRS